MTPLDAHLVGEAARDAVRRARLDGQPVLARVVLPLCDAPDSADLLGQIRRFAGDRAFFWRAAGDSLAFAACGAALEIDACGAERFVAVARRATAVAASMVVRSGLPSQPRLPLFVGGFAFSDAEARSQCWSGFPPARFWVPERLSLVSAAGERAVAASTLALPGEAVETVQARLAAAVTPSRASQISADRSPPCYTVRPDCDAVSWESLVRQALAAIRRGELEKVVVARTCLVEADALPAPEQVAANLARRYPRCTAFLCRNGGGSFVGASPELLVGLRSGEVVTQAVAGTRPRRMGEREDRESAGELLTSDKERREHAVVVGAIRDALAPVCAGLHAIPEPEVGSFEDVHHLVTSIRGRTSDSVTLPELAARLHPTPAVAGWPRQSALEWLDTHERLDRGWYTGAVGWLDGGMEGELAVALRCCLMRDGCARLFAGAGIVEGSQPASELAETRLKLQPVLQALLEV